MDSDSDSISDSEVDSTLVSAVQNNNPASSLQVIILAMMHKPNQFGRGGVGVATLKVQASAVEVRS